MRFGFALVAVGVVLVGWQMTKTFVTPVLFCGGLILVFAGALALLEDIERRE